MPKPFKSNPNCKKIVQSGHTGWGLYFFATHVKVILQIVLVLLIVNYNFRVILPRNFLSVSFFIIMKAPDQIPLQLLRTFTFKIILSVIMNLLNFTISQMKTIKYYNRL